MSSAFFTLGHSELDYEDEQVKSIFLLIEGWLSKKDRGQSNRRVARYFPGESRNQLEIRKLRLGRCGLELRETYQFFYLAPYRTQLDFG